jgi:molybdenum cofactor cytidylyltransferase
LAQLDGIILAAGESRRMGYPKPLLKIGEQLFVDRVIETMVGRVGRLIVVLGAHRERIRPLIAGMPLVIAENADYRNGQLSSLKAGLAHVRAEASAVMVHLADHPLVKPSTVATLKREYEQGGKPLVIARCNGRRGHPVIFRRDLFDELIAAPEELGARVVVNADPQRVHYVDVDDNGVVLDLDTPDDLIRAGLAPPPDVF